MPWTCKLAPLGRVPRQLGVVLDVGGEAAEVLRFLSVREIRGHLEHLGADHQAGSEVPVVAGLRLALVAFRPLGVAVDKRGAHHGGIRACLQRLDVDRSRSCWRMRASASRAAWSSSRNVTAVS